MDNKFTEKIGAWLNTPDSERDYSEGAIMLLQLTNNKIMYNNIRANPRARAEFIEYNLRKYHNFRLQQLTHDVVEQMRVEVKQIVADHLSLSEDTEAKNFRAGKRVDHDELPDEIKALFERNFEIARRMRECHVQLRHAVNENTVCIDSEEYPFLQELIALDKEYHHNWDMYDHYVGEPTTPKKLAKRRTKK